MHLQNPTLNNQDRQKAIEFAQDILDIGNDKNIKNKTRFAL